MKNERLKMARENRNITLAKLANDVDVSVLEYHQYEDGVLIPNVAVALRLARSLMCKVEDIFEEVY